MRASLNWLRQYVDVTATPEELAATLTMAGLEIESIERLGEKYHNFVIGRVLEVAKHPNADKLRLCKVDVGSQELQIVCGAPNVAADQKVIVGLVGATVPKNQHDPDAKPFTLTKAKIRGQESYGMICSEYELGLGDDKDGILVLSDGGVAPGTPLVKFLGLDDIALEVGITPNRPDAMSHVGLARDIAALYRLPLTMPAISITEDSSLITDAVQISIEDTENCPRYTARVVTGVTVAESPAWLKKYLETIGVRPVNNVVDITNYVLMEIGQPIHAFDYDRLNGHTIVVRRASEGETFVTLDHKERKLTADTLMICDGERPVAIAGIMGGENSEISTSTKNVLIESAYFKPQSIRRSSKYFGLSTDASQRFERGTDPNVTAWAADRVAMLLQEVCGGKVLKGSIDVYPQPIQPKTISLRAGRTNATLGTDIPASAMPGLLEKLGIQLVSSKGDEMAFAVPTFRPDIEREIDLVEEVARIHGYDNIETKVRVMISLPDHRPPADLTAGLREWLIGRGFNEVVSNSMQPKSVAVETSDTPVEVANPISKDMATLRTSISTSLLQIARNNIFHGTRDLRLFEIGKTYSRVLGADPLKLSGYVEETRIGLLMSGMAVHKGWSNPQGRATDLFDLKGELEALAAKNSLDKFKFIPYTTGNALTDLGLNVEINGALVGFIGKVREEVLKKYEIEQEVFIVELTLEGVKQAKARKYEPLPVYPSVLRDLALVVDEGVPVETLMASLRSAGGKLVTAVQLFDIYRGNQIDPGKKSCAFALQLQSPDRTLSQEEIDVVVQRMIEHATSEYHATVRM